MILKFDEVAHEYENISRTITLTLEDKDPTDADYYLYFKSVTGTYYKTANPIDINNGVGVYEVDNDIADEIGYFSVQAGAEKANGYSRRSSVYDFYVAYSLPEGQAYTPSGTLITLQEVYDALRDLSASDVGYIDTYGIGADTAQGAIDYAVLNGGGGGGGSLPVYRIYWHNNPTQAQKQANVTAMNAIFNAEPGSYLAYVIHGNVTIPISSVDRSLKVLRASYTNDLETVRIYSFSGTSLAQYDQDNTILPADQFDEASPAPAGMDAIAEYVDERIGTTGNIDPSDFASASDVEAIESKMPSAASSSNQLADKNFVNSSVATNTAYFIGTFDSVAELEAYSGTLTNNDYAFVIVYDPVETTEVKAYDRYKYNASTEEWIFEYELNNSSFTAAQWAAINSAITASKVTTYDAHVADSTIHVTAALKATWDAKYDKPPHGIPKTDLASVVQTSLGKADTAVQFDSNMPIGNYVLIEASGTMTALQPALTNGATLTWNGTLSQFESIAKKATKTLIYVGYQIESNSSYPFYQFQFCYFKNALYIYTIYDGKLYTAELAEVNGSLSGTLVETAIGGGGTAYIGGTGIDITNDVISLDSETQAEIAKIAGKQDTIPVYVLQYDAQEAYKTENLEILTAIRTASVGSYAVFVKVETRYFPAVTIQKGTTPYVVAFDAGESSSMVMYEFRGRTSSAYSETATTVYFGGGGTTYTAGTGIDITGTTISVDNTVETKPTETSGSNATVTIATLADNTEYRYTDLETLTVSAYPSGHFEAWMRLTFASSGTITVTLPTSLYIGSAPTFGNGETWEISIKDGVVVAGKAS